MLGIGLRRHLIPTLLTAIVCTGNLSASVPAQEPDAVTRRYLDILKTLGKENYDRAIADLKTLISEHPEFPRSYRKLVEVYIYLEDLQSAQAYFDSLLAEDDRNPYTYYAVARIDYQKKEYDQAIEKLKTAIALDPSYVEAYGPNGGLVDVYKAKGELDAAIGFLSELRRKDPANACVYYALGRTHLRNNDYENALRLLNTAVELNPDFAFAYRSLDYIYYMRTEYDKGLQAAKELLRSAENIHDPDEVAYALLQTGGYYYLQGDYWKALSEFSKALKIGRNIGAKRTEGIALNNLAAVYAMLGQKSKALDYFEAALELARKTRDIVEEIRTLTNIGHIYKDRGDYSRSLDYYEKALAAARRADLPSKESFVMSSMGDAYHLLGDESKALDNYDRAMRIAQEQKDNKRIAYIFLSLGILYQKQGHLEDALQSYTHAVEIGTELNHAQIIWEGESGIGATYEKRGNPKQAIRHYANAIALYDSVRGKLGLASLGVSFLEDKYAVYPSIVQLLAHQGRLKEAFLYAEKYKAKSLLDVLAKGRIQLDAQLPDSLRARIQQIQAQLDEAHAALSRELAKKVRDQARVLELDQQITDLQLQKADITDQVKTKFASYYQLTSAEPLAARELQRQVLGSDQTLIEYLVGPEKLSVFLVANDTLVYQELPVSREKLRTLVAKLSPIFAPESGSDQKHRNEVLNAQLADFSVPPAHALYQMLIQPLEPWLAGATELVIVPDDILFYLPFEALVADTSGVQTRYDFDKATFLVENYAISYAPSASLLDPRLQRPRHPQQELLALGNPDFGRKTTDQDLPEILAETLPFSGNIVRGGAFVPLPNSEAEVKAIRKALRGSQTHIYTGARATEEIFKKESARHRILHLATHFLANDENPLYSKIVLAQRQNQKDDGYLQTYEVFNLRLNADLVVLSACNTGLGKLRKGEGLIGVSRAFLYAGVPSLVVSLWSVDDKATSILMEHFYRYLRAGLNKKQALRQAKIDYLQAAGAEASDPFFWAPFVLIGDWSPMSFPPAPRPLFTLWMATLLVSSISMIAGAILLRKRAKH